MTREEAKTILEEVKMLDDSMYQYNPIYLEALDMAISALSFLERRKETVAERTKQNLSELAQYNSDMLKAFNAGKELVERETTYLDHYTKIKEWAKNNGFVLVTEEWYDKARVAYYWRYYGER